MHAVRSLSWSSLRMGQAPLICQSLFLPPTPAIATVLSHRSHSALGRKCGPGGGDLPLDPYCRDPLCSKRCSNDLQRRPSVHASLLHRRRSPSSRTPWHTVCRGFGSERHHAARMPLRALCAVPVFRQVVLDMHAPPADRIRVIRLQRRAGSHRHPSTDRSAAPPSLDIDWKLPRN
jgi:hypothetical protein